MNWTFYIHREIYIKVKQLPFYGSQTKLIDINYPCRKVDWFHKHLLREISDFARIFSDFSLNGNKLFFLPISDRCPSQFQSYYLPRFLSRRIITSFDYVRFPGEWILGVFTRGYVVQLKVFIYLAPASQRNIENIIQWYSFNQYVGPSLWKDTNNSWIILYNFYTISIL